VPIILPPLRERKSDIPTLSRHFVDKYNKKLNKKIAGIDDEALQLLQVYAWPGNIRELENLMERVILFADGPTIGAKDLPEPVHPQGAVPSPPAAAGEAAAGETGLKDIIKQKSAELERDLIAKALEETSGNVTRAAKLLQISRKSLQTKMKEFGLR